MSPRREHERGGISAILHWPFTGYLTLARLARRTRAMHAVRQTPPAQLESRGVSTPAASAVPGVVGDPAAALPWYRQVSRDQWRAFWAVFLGWVVDSFDFNILAFIIIDIQESFTVDRALAGALGHGDADDAAGRRHDRRNRGRQVGTQAAADALGAVVLALRVPQRILDVVRDAVRASARCSASAWAASGRPACRSCSSTGRRGCAAWPRG